MSLYSQFKTDATIEKEGIFVEYGANSKGLPIRFRVARAGGANSNFKKSFEKHSLPFRHLMRANKLDEETSMRITRLVFIESVLLGWENVEDKAGEPLEFSAANANMLFTDLPGLLLDLSGHAADSELFLEELRKADAGN